MTRTIKLHIIDYSKARGIGRFELSPGVTAEQYSGLLHLVCEKHAQPLTEGPLRFLALQSGRWIDPGEDLATTTDIGSEAVAVSEAVRAALGDDTSPYKAIICLRAASDEIAHREQLEALANSIINMSRTLDDALQRSQRILEAKPGFFGFALDLRALWDLIRNRWPVIKD